MKMISLIKLILLLKPMKFYEMKKDIFLREKARNVFKIKILYLFTRIYPNGNSNFTGTKDNLSKIVLDTDYKEFANKMKDKYTKIFTHIRNEKFAQNTSTIEQTLKNFYESNNNNELKDFTHTVIFNLPRP